MGFAGIFMQADSRLENAITAVQAQVDGGTRPDNSTELSIKSIISDLQTIELNLKNLWTKSLALTVDELKVDPVRGMMMLRMEGRRLVNHLARTLSTRPRDDAFSSSSPSFDGDTFEELYEGPAGKDV